MIRVNAQIELDEREIQEDFVRASGPGGQNVNKVSSEVQLRFNVLTSLALTDWAREMLLRSGKLTNDGVLVITAQRFREQEKNRADARDRLAEIIRAAAVPPKPRRPTSPTLASKTRRLDGKTKRGAIKRLRAGKPSLE